MYVPDATDIRESHANISRKLRSLQIAINERRQQLQTVEGFLSVETDGAIPNRRLRSARVKPPRYVTALQGALQRDLSTLRSEYDRGRQADTYQGREAHQLSRLVNNLEKRFDDIVQSLYIPADVIRDNRESHVTSKGSPQEDNGRSSESREGSSSSRLPNIHQPASARDSVSDVTSLKSVTFSCPSIIQSDDVCADASDLTKEGELKNIEKSESPVKRDLSDDVIREDEDEERSEGENLKSDSMLALSRSYTTLNKYPLRSNMATVDLRGASQRRSSVVGYPYGSSFPSLPPLPVVRRQKVNRFHLPVTLTGSEALNRPTLGRSKTMMATKLTREKTWFY